MKSLNCSWWYTLLVNVRPIIAHRYLGIFGLPHFIYNIIFADRKLYNERRKSFWKTKNLEEICQWFNLNYEYKADLLHGFFDHDNSELEFFTTFGDCDDAALYACRALKKLGYNAKRIYMVNNTKGMQSGHVDCIVQYDAYNFMIFDYAKPIYGNTVEECMEQLCNRWYARNNYRNVQWIVK